jgi:hypothetical protein
MSIKLLTIGGCEGISEVSVKDHRIRKWNYCLWLLWIDTYPVFPSLREIDGSWVGPSWGSYQYHGISEIGCFERIEGKESDDILNDGKYASRWVTFN